MSSPLQEQFPGIVAANVPLGPFTHLKLGGPAEFLAQPRSREELCAVVRACFQHKLPLRLLGSGCNILVREDGVKGLVLRLGEPAFTGVAVAAQKVSAGGGGPVSALISQAARHGLAGLESLVGIAGSVGGALRCNAGDRAGDISQFVHQVEVIDPDGQVRVRERDELRFGYHWSNLDDPVILAAEFHLEPDSPEAIDRRMRRTWILRKATQPLTLLPSVRAFKDPRGLNAAALVEQAGLGQTRVGGAEVSERDSNCIVVHPGATARDVLRLIDLMRGRVQERFNVPLELEVTIW